MLTEPEPIQRQRVLLRQARTANQARVNTEATIADLHQVCLNAQQEAQQTLQDIDLAKLFSTVNTQKTQKNEAALPALKVATDRAVCTQKKIGVLTQAYVVSRAEAARRRRWMMGILLTAAILIILWNLWLQLEAQREVRLTTQWLAEATAQVVVSQATATSQAVEAQAQREQLARTILDAGGWRNPIDDALYVYVPAGSFRMGSDSGDNDEQPVHIVNLGDYWIMRTEVTNAQYGQCIAAGVCTPPYNSRQADYPVTNVDWSKAIAYCTWAGVRLPTEAEWEKAARGIDERTYPWGNAAPTYNLANFAGNVDRTMPVGSYPDGISPYGALNMAGNVWEWVNDWYSSSYYSRSPERNPQGPATGTYHVLRGGSWDSPDSRVRSAIRHSSIPSFQNLNIGFRCVRSP